MKLPDLPIKLPDLPKKVAISAVIIVASAVLSGVLLPTLGANRDRAIADNGKLQTQIAQLGKNIEQVRADYKYVTENREKFEALLQSERLIPHTRRDAAQRLQALALKDGVTSLTWDMATAGDRSLAAVASQAKTDAYRVSVESIALHIGAPLDGPVYRFLVDLNNDFPGAAVVASVDLGRTEKLTNEIIDRLGHGGDSGLVKGEVKMLWRTAQATDSEKKTP